MRIFISRDGEEIGDWPPMEVMLLYRTGELLSTDSYWREGMEAWQPLATFGSTPAPAQSLPPEPALPAAEIPSPPSPDHAPPPSRRNWIVPILLAFFGAAILLSVGVYLVRHRASDQTVAEINTYAEQQRRQAAQDLATRGYVHLDANKTQQEIVKLRAMSQEQGGPEKKMTDTMLDVMGQLSTLAKACQVAEERMLALGLNPAKITSLDELQKRREAVQACRPPVAQLQQFLQQIDPGIREILNAKGVTPPQIDSFLVGLHRSGHVEALKTYWRMEDSILTDLLFKLDLLKDNWGKWRLENDTIIFDNADALATYNENERKFQADVARQKVAQNEALAPPSPN